MVALCGLGGAGKTSVALEYAHRHLAEIGVAWQFPAEDPTVLAAGFGELAAQLGARDLLDARDPVASVHAVLAAYPAVAAGVRQRAGPGIGAAVPAAGRDGRVLITSQNPNWPPGQALDVPVLDPEVAAGFLVNRTGDPDRQAARSWPGSWAGCRWRWSRPPPTSRPPGTAWPVTWRCSGSGGRTCWPAASPPGMARRWRPPGRWRSAGWSSPRPAAVGLLRLLAFCAPEAIPLRLLLQPRPGLAGRFGGEVAPVLAPLLEDPLAAEDAIAALRRYSLVSPAADGSVLGAPAGAGCHARPDACRAGRRSGGRPPPR